VRSPDVNLKAKDGVLDAIIGVRGRYGLGGDNWYIPYYLDLGTGESDLTWQATSGIGYAFGHFDLSMTYRHLEWQFSSSKVMQSLSFSGPVFGVGFRW
jgi:hypothetical protein